MKDSNTVIILGSARSNGDTRRVADLVAERYGFDIIDLNDFDISYYDYDHLNENDDFIPLMENITTRYDHLVFATPVYWYTMSAVMKNFFDRLSDLLTIRKDLGRKLRGRALSVISCSSDNDVTVEFEAPFRDSASYLGMQYLGHVHTWKNGRITHEDAKKHLFHFYKNSVRV